MKTGGKLIVEALEANGVDRIFCVPGESYLAVLDALYSSNQIRTIVCRQEGGAAMMADCQGQLTGQPGICFVTRGPGATNASAGVHIAMQDSTPMILFIGQVASHAREREAFQEVDYKRFFGDIAKWVVEIDDAARIPELVTRAFSVATSGRPGPVVVSLPEDMLTDLAEAPDALPCTPVETRPGEHEMQQLEELLVQGRAPLRHPRRHPLERRGGSPLPALRPKAGRCRSAAPSAARCCSTTSTPATPAMSASAPIRSSPPTSRSADLILLVGGRMSEMPSSDYTLLKSPYPRPEARPRPSGRRRTRPRLPPDACHQRLARRLRRGLRRARPQGAAGLGRRHAGAARLLSRLVDAARNRARRRADGPDHGLAGERLPDDAIITNGAGNYATWAHRFHRWRRFGTQAAPTSGSMGYGTPAAVAAKALHPDREVICFAGDGCFLMNGQEFATAVQYELPIIVIVVNNGMYGTIRMHQEREYPGRVSGTDLKNPDFAALARAYGGHGETVENTADFAPAFERARASGKPAIIEIRLDPEAITPTKTLTDIREKR